ncbi:hypothetical protein BDW22DRAFT_1391232 [Trametopsis cervina]|nr:hypothetical protein BDW22DRAFT_1391232 [Trametopsis cervina]
MYDELEEEEEDLLLAAALVVLGAEDTRQQHRMETRRRTRQYLTRPELLPNPRVNTPWQQLYESRSDRAFITTMGVDVATFEYLLEAGFADEWNFATIPRNDTNPAGNPRPGARSLDAAGGLGLYLHWISSTMPETSLQLIFALIPSTVSRYVTFAQRIILHVLHEIPEGTIQWPSDEQEFSDLAALVQARHHLLTGAFGSIDGVNLPVHVSDDPQIENATYNGWLHAHFISCVIVFGSDGLIKQAVLNAPGSWHDSRVARPIYAKLRDHTPDGFYLVADTAFPRGTDQINGRIRAALKQGAPLPDDMQERANVLYFDRQLLSYRQTAEWGMRTLQGSFGRLRLPLNAEDKHGRSELLEVCMRLSNVRTLRVGINQIRNVYMPIWQNEADGKMWSRLGDMLFSEIRQHDRVARFHAVV